MTTFSRSNHHSRLTPHCQSLTTCVCVCVCVCVCARPYMQLAQSFWDDVINSLVYVSVYKRPLRHRSVNRLANSELGHSGTPSSPFLSLPSPPSFSPTLLPSLSPGAPTHIPARGSAGALKAPSGSVQGSGAKPHQTNDLVHIWATRSWNSLTLFLWCNSYIDYNR